MIDSLWPDDLTILTAKDARFIRARLELALCHLKFFPDNPRYNQEVKHWKQVVRGIKEKGSFDTLVDWTNDRN